MAERPSPPALLVACPICQVAAGLPGVATGADAEASRRPPAQIDDAGVTTRWHPFR